MPEILPLGISIGSHASSSWYVHPSKKDVRSVLRSSYGEEWIPSSAFIRKSDGSIEIGEEALRRRFEPATLGTYLSSPVMNLPDITPGIASSLEPQTIASTVARQLRYMTESLNRLDPTFKPGTIAISAPALLVEHWKDPFDQAFREAGLEMAEVVSELEAALTASLEARGRNPLPKVGERAMVLNWGHVSLEITTLKMIDYVEAETFVFHREHHVSLPCIGGEFINDLLINYLFKDFARESGKRLNLNEILSLLKHIERAKITLVDRVVRGIHDEVPFPGLEGKSSLIPSTMTPLEFKRLLKEPSEALTHALDAVGANRNLLHHVIAVGGNSHLPFVRDALEKTLETEKGSIWKFPLESLFATQAVSRGTTLIASSIQNRSPRRVRIEQGLALTGDIVCAVSRRPKPPADSSSDWLVVVATGTPLEFKTKNISMEILGTGASLFIHFSHRTSMGTYHKAKSPVMIHDGMYALEPSSKPSLMNIIVESPKSHPVKLSVSIETGGYRIGPIPITIR